MSNHTSNNIRNIIQESMDAHRAMRPSRLQSRADSVQINLEGSATLGDDDTPVVAEGSATASSFSRPANGQETPILPLSHHKGKAGDSTSGSRKQKSPEQLERKKERRRRAQQVRRMINSDKQNQETTPRVFMQWEKSEVQRLLYKQELTLKSAHQAELQKQAAILKQRDQQHNEAMSSLLRIREKIAGVLPISSHPAYHHIRRASLLLDQLDDGVFWALKGLIGEGDLQVPTDEGFDRE